MGIIQFRHNRSAICRGARLVTILMCKLKSYQYRKPIDSLVLSQYAVRYAVSRYSTSSVPSTMEDDNATQLAASPLQYCTKYRTDCTWYFYYIIIIGVCLRLYHVLSCSILFYRAQSRIYIYRSGFHPTGIEVVCEIAELSTSTGS
jgi:hypothetical protein